jgi:hypothetical protein
LLDDGSIEIEFAYRNGDEAVLKPNATLLQQPARSKSASRKVSPTSRRGRIIKIIDMAPIVRAIEGEPEAADLVQRRWSCAVTGITAAQQKGRPKPPKSRNCG